MILAASVLSCAAAAAQPSGYDVLVKTGAAEPVAFAAGELSRYCAQMFSRSFDCHEVGDLDNGPAIVLLKRGQSRTLPSALVAEAGALGPEGFVVKAEPGRVAIAAGGPRGAVYGVYTFLEKCLGCRWYYPSPEDQIVPQHDLGVLEALMAKRVALAQRPDFAYREREFRDVNPMTPQTDDRIIEQIDWWAKLRMNCFLINFNYARGPKLWARWKQRLIPEIKKRGLLLGIGEHGSYPLFLNPADYAKDHPTWYAMIGGKRLKGWRVEGSGRLAQWCTTNPEALKTYLRNFAQFAKDSPEIDVFYPAPNDGGAWCECERCRGQSVADRYLALDNEVAKTLVAIRPDYRVIHLAYANHRLPPEHVAPHPNVDADVACWGRDFAYPMSNPLTMRSKKDYLEVFQKWVEISRAANQGKSRTLYHCKFMRHLWLGPRFMPLSVVDADMPHLRQLGLDGFDLPLGFVGMWTKAPNAYVVAHKCWDADADFKAIVDEYFKLYYREQSAAARRACLLADEALPQLRYGNNFSLIWSRTIMTPRTTNPKGLAGHAANAAAKLADAADLAATSQTQAANAVARGRLRKLEIALRNVQREQTFTQALASVAELLHQAEQGGDANALAPQAKRLLDDAERVAEQMKAAYRMKDDLAGLLWAGGTHGRLAKAAHEWRRFAEDLLSGIQWHEAATWRTEEFPDKHTIVDKEVDVTDLVRVAGPVLVRWKWTGGQLGVHVHETSLWEVRGVQRKCISRDPHRGRTGARDTYPLYRLRIERVEPGARYLVVGKLQADCGHGTVAERGTSGKVKVGAKQAEANTQ